MVGCAIDSGASSTVSSDSSVEPSGIGERKLPTLTSKAKGLATLREGSSITDDGMTGTTDSEKGYDGELGMSRTLSGRRCRQPRIDEGLMTVYWDGGATDDTTSFETLMTSSAYLDIFDTNSSKYELESDVEPTMAGLANVSGGAGAFIRPLVIASESTGVRLDFILNLLPFVSRTGATILVRRGHDVHETSCPPPNDPSLRINNSMRTGRRNKTLRADSQTVWLVSSGHNEPIVQLQLQTTVLDWCKYGDTHEVTCVERQDRFSVQARPSRRELDS
ncbi:hypothetical protein BU15DRAFT_65918 [Melanogaster broomeanus]|nr:hypothetical protein BU15DRAFT_65918 [Melanogaster broomeanus]